MSQSSFQSLQERTPLIEETLMKVSASEGPPTGQARCGWPCWSPTFLHKFATFPYFLFCLCMNALLQGMIVNGFISTSISSIEKRFALSSTKSGIFSATYDVAVFVMLVPLSYMAHKVNKVRIIGYGMILVGIGSIFNTLPHFLDGHYSVGELQSDICDPSRKEACDLSQIVSSWSYPVLIFSQVLVGIGAAPIFTYGYSTLDEFDSTKRTAKNMARYMAAATLGPAIAFIGGGQMLNIWGDSFKTDYHELGITGPKDPRWYGAWWIGFDIVGALCIFFAIPLTMFPRKLRDTDERKKEDEIQTHHELDVDFTGQKFVILKTFRLFFFNATCMALIAMQTIESLIMNGYITFIPKLFENMFGFSSSMSSTVTGAIVVPMGVVGSWLGGKLASKVENRVTSMLKITIVLLVVTLVFSSCMLLPCERGQIAGINSPYSPADSKRNLIDSCNQPCICENIFNPVCADGGKISYFSPCHAGCSSPSTEDHRWLTCNCVTLRNLTSSNVSKGWCSTDCNLTKYVFFGLFALVCLFVFATAPLIQSASMKIVTFDHRDSYICFSWLWMRGLGSVPGAVLFGMVIDKTCQKWIQSCGNDSKCVLYDADVLGKYIFLFTLVTKILCIIALLITIRSYHPISSTGNENSEIREVPSPKKPVSESSI